MLIPTSIRFKETEVGAEIRRGGASMMLSTGEFLGQYYPDQLDDTSRGAPRAVAVFEGPRGREAIGLFAVSRNMPGATGIALP